jgi:serine/threonine protein kinase
MNYNILSKLGHGGMATVYLAQDKKFDTEEFYDDTFSDSPPKFYYDIAQFDEKLNGYIEHLEIYEEEIFFDLLEDDNYSKNPIGSVYKWLDIANGDNFNESNLDNNIKLYVNLVMEELYETVASFGENKAKSFKSLVQDKLEKIDKDITEGKFPPQGKNATLDGVCDGIVVTANGLRLLGNFNMNDFNKRYDEVMTENFKKYCRTEESAKRTLLKHYNNEDYFYEKAKDGSDFFVIRRKSDNKIMKGEDYFTHINKK